MPSAHRVAFLGDANVIIDGEQGTEVFLHPVELHHHFIQRKLPFRNLDPGGFQSLVVPVEMPVGDHHRLKHMRTQIVRAAPGIALPEGIGLSVYGTAVTAQKDISLVSKIPLGEVDGDDFEDGLAGHLKPLALQFHEIGNSPGRMAHR